jgi:hypothetical protein
MPLTPARRRELKHQLRCLFFELLLPKFEPSKAWGEYLALVGRMDLLRIDEDRKEYLLLVEEVFRTMPRNFQNPEEWMAIQKEYDKHKSVFLSF